jgi:cobalt-zinc-cadmium efflux system protein
MEGTPEHLDVDEIREAIRGVDGVTGVHDLHVWSITSGMVSLSAHVERAAERAPGRILGDVQDTLRDRFRIRHCTLQVEPPDFSEEKPGW